MLEIQRPLLLIHIIKLNRLLLIAKMPIQIGYFSSKFPHLAKYFNIFKPIFYLVLISHLVACFFNYCIIVSSIDFAFLNNDFLGWAMGVLQFRQDFRKNAWALFSSTIKKIYYCHNFLPKHHDNNGIPRINYL